MDEIKPTPRNELLGLLADSLRGGLSFATNEGKNKPMNLLAELLGLPAIQKTTERLSYGEPLTTGKGLTTRLQPETFDAAMGVLPFAGSMAKGANLAAEGLNKGAAMIGKAAAPSTERLVNAVMARGGLPAQLMQDMAQGTKSPAIVWHGSPHKFDAFDASKIGTGEGAQAYGHGLYLADNPAVAKEYQTKLSSTGASKHLASQYGGIDDGLAEAQRRVESYKKIIADGGGGSMSTAKNMLNIAEKNVKDLSDMRAGLPENTGALYKVDLPDEHIAKMLDWDKPLSQQAPEVRDILEKLPQSSNLFTTRPAPKNGLTEILSPSGDGMGYYQPHEVNEALKDLSGGFFKKIAGKELTAEDIYSRLANASTKTGVENKFGISLNGQPAASELLRQQGITGIKYLDGGSRAAGAGSQNFVIFPGNERLLKILERNGESVAPKFDYPQSEALKLAQQRAALPVSEGGLGLPANNTAMDRAGEMGFDTKTPLYHGTGADIQAFDPRMAGRNDEGLWGKGQYLATSPDSASSYALREGDGANVIPAYAAVKNPMRITTGKDLITRMPDGTDTRTLIGENLNGRKIKEIGQASGHDSIFQIKPNGNVGDIVTFDPDVLRSKFAAFDPWRRNAAIAASMGVAAPDLLAKDNNELATLLKSKK